MRLFLFLSLVAFFAVQGSIDYDEDGKGKGVHVGAPQKDSFDSANTPAEVERARKLMLDELQKAHKEAENVPGAVASIEVGMAQVNRKADRRLEHLAKVEAARKAGKPAPAEGDDDEDMNFQVNGKRWDEKTNPIDFAWLPDRANKSLNKRIAHARDVLKSSKSEKPVVDAMFNVLPQTLLLMMPLFALMLKVAYLFKRRMYMEHLIVALHSHAFMALAVTLIMGLSFLMGIVPGEGMVHSLLSFLRTVIIVWIPLYLLIMQKRVYAQGWAMTIAKYSVLGLCYTILLSIGMVASILVGLLTL
jgi:hypothetical protein